MSLVKQEFRPYTAPRLLHDLDPECFEAHDATRVVRQQADAVQAEVREDLLQQ